MSSYFVVVTLIFIFACCFFLHKKTDKASRLSVFWLVIYRIAYQISSYYLFSYSLTVYLLGFLVIDVTMLIIFCIIMHRIPITNKLVLVFSISSIINASTIFDYSFSLNIGLGYGELSHFWALRSLVEILLIWILIEGSGIGQYLADFFRNIWAFRYRFYMPDLLRLPNHSRKWEAKK